MKHLLKSIILMACIFLNACSGNPLQKQSPHDSARLISEACLSAMKHLGFREPGMSDRYAQCMERQTSPTFDCDHLYQTMANTFHAKGVKMRVSHLTDPKFYQQIKEELQKRSYFSF